MNRYISLNRERKKPSWITLSAFFRLSFFMTTEMFSSDEPWAVATTFIPFLPRDLKSVAEIPGVFFIRSPTIAIIERFFSIRIFISLSVSYTHLRAHETVLDLVCRLLLEKNKK